MRKSHAAYVTIAVCLGFLSSYRIICGVVALGADVLCGRVAGLTGRQRDMCRAAPEAMVAIGDGVRLGRLECQHQFRHQRWNCTPITSAPAFGHVVVVGSREAAFTYAISSAGVTYSITAACARGSIPACGCAPLPRGLILSAAPSPRDGQEGAAFKWGGCSADVAFGIKFAKRFLDARELEGDARTLMNLHNNKAGRKIVKMSLITECKCHGVSGSCAMRTCWKTLPTFRLVGDALMKKYNKARPVVATNHPASTPGNPRQTRALLRLVLKRSTANRLPPKRSELVYLADSPNYCDRNAALGSLGTTGRFCNRTSQGTEGCDLMCCGRGYDTHQYTRTWQCRCTFRWCCHVDCDTCTEKTEEYTCK